MGMDRYFPLLSKAQLCIKNEQIEKSKKVTRKQAVRIQSSIHNSEFPRLVISHYGANPV